MGETSRPPPPPTRINSRPTAAQSLSADAISRCHTVRRPRWCPRQRPFLRDLRGLHQEIQDAKADRQDERCDYEQPTHVSTSLQGRCDRRIHSPAATTLTRYTVEHIAPCLGTRVRFIPPPRQRVTYLLYSARTLRGNPEDRGISRHSPWQFRQTRKPPAWLRGFLPASRPPLHGPAATGHKLAVRGFVRA